MFHKMKRHLAPHMTTLALGLLLVVVSVVATVRVMSADVSPEVAQVGETVIVSAMAYPTDEITVLRGSVLENPINLGCLASPMTYLADTTIFAVYPGKDSSANDVAPLLFSKPLATGTRLGDFGPAASCNGFYTFSAQVKSTGPSTEVAQPGETVIVMSSQVPQGDFTVLSGSALEYPLMHQCTYIPEAGFIYRADTNSATSLPGTTGDRGGLSNPAPFFFSKPVAAGTRLGEFSPAVSCAGNYVYTATVLN